MIWPLKFLVAKPWVSCKMAGSGRCRQVGNRSAIFVWKRDQQFIYLLPAPGSTQAHFCIWAKKRQKGGVGGISWRRAKRKERAFFLKTHQAHAPPFPAPPPPRPRANSKSGHSGGMVGFCKRTSPGAVLEKRKGFCSFFQKKRSKPETSNFSLRFTMDGPDN